MSNEKLARGRAENTARLRRWAESVLAMPAGHHDEDVIAAAEHILATTTDPLTMADVEWDDEKHRGAGATDTKGKTWVMFQDDGDYISCIGLGMNTCGVPAEELTPNGKRYKLVEVTGDEHPETLTTLEDYENAPEGTIVAQDGCDSWVKTNTNIWACGVVTYVNRDMSATGPYRVLRWGWGE